ncbi:MAG: helix-turn-helix transcriptional regulator [Ruminococcaceae bacterium]|nr:helix-turn-helix transcriptional regulator [Oscillospiraceae bacterium]
MNKNIGLNIKELRQKANMTQNMLAEKLGVSFQSVSRWETGASYPDITLLPLIASVFDVTIDNLFGISTNEVDKRIEEFYNCRRKGYDHKQLIEEARGICRDFPKERDPKYILFDLLSAPLSDEKEKREGIKLGYELINSATSEDDWHKTVVIGDMIAILPDDELDKFIAEYVQDRSLDAMLITRYRRQKDDEKFLRQYAKTMYSELWYFFNCFHLPLLGMLKPEQRLSHCEMKIKILNALTQFGGDSLSVLGDGEVDIFTLWRINWGTLMAAFTNDEEKSVKMINEVLSLFDKIRSFPENTPLETRNPLFAPIKIYVEHEHDKKFTKLLPEIVSIGASGIDPGFIKHNLETPFFDWLKNNEEFKMILEKLS